MKYNEFVGEVQHRLELAEMGEAVRATRAVLSTLGERLHEGEATDLASPLPMEIDRFLTEVEHEQRFDYDEFVERVAEREGVEPTDANFHAQQVVAVVAEVAPAGNIEKAHDALPADFDRLFELIDSEATPED